MSTSSSATLDALPEPYLDRLRWKRLFPFGITVFQFGLLILLVRTFHIESPAFLRLMFLAWLGFIIHHFLPRRLQLAFFGCLSAAGIVLVLGLNNALWLFAIGLSLIGLAHLPIAFRWRILILILAGTGLFLLRGAFVNTPVSISTAIWPILGSMFMFRMIIYLYDLKHNAAPFSWWHAVAYFFMLPNVCFPLFPVIDYKTFCRTRNAEEDLQGYQNGLAWILRGFIHLLLYRFIYQNFIVDPETITSAGQSMQLIVATFLLYLRISGTFHLIVGLLRLFGFHLPETHHNFLFSSSFTDHWRRINIYWKDFILKHVFNPIYFPLRKRLGDARGMLIAVICSFLLTWLLHTYQWFWIRGKFELRWQDAIFWGFLGIVVCINMFLEVRRGRRRHLKKVQRTRFDDLSLALRTIATFIAICLFWSIWSANSTTEMQLIFAPLLRATWLECLVLLVLLIGLGLAAVILGRTAMEVRKRIPGVALSENPAWFWRTATIVSVLCALLLLVGNNPALLSFAPRLAGATDRLVRNELNARDLRQLERGYYESLSTVGHFDDQLAALYARRPADWKGTEPTTRATGSYPPYELIPSNRVMYKGVLQGANQFGMRDREYTLSKPAQTLRIALFGASHSKGSGVDDQLTYENLTEDRFNSQANNNQPIEILNFAVGGYGPLSRLAVLKNRALVFEPDMAIFVAIDDFTWLANEIANAVQKQHPIPFTHIKQILQTAGIEPGTPQIVVRQRIKPYIPELLNWVYREFVSTCRSAGLQPLLMVLPRPNIVADEAELISQQSQLGQKAGFTVLDMSGAYDAISDRKTLYLAAWDKHPNAKGHELLAAWFYAALSDQLKRKNIQIQSE